MTTKDAFTDEEWTRVCRAPFVAGMALSMADPGGPIELSRETAAMLRAAVAPSGDVELLGAIAAEITGEVQRHENPMSGFKPANPALAGKELLDELKAASDLVAANATGEEATAYDAWLVSAGQAAANAAKEGGFFGVGAVQVSDREQQMLDQIRATLGVS
jgi:hypothetical protein